MAVRRPLSVATVALLQTTFALSCSNSNAHSHMDASNADVLDCPWAGQGEAVVTVNDPGSPIRGGIGTCASGAYLSAGNNDRELQVCGPVFDFNVSIGPTDTTTGARTLAAQSVEDGTARLTFIAITPAGTGVYLSAPDGVGTVSLTSNFQSSGQPFEGSFDHVHMTLQSCSVPPCTSYPATLTLSGTFFGVAR